MNQLLLAGTFKEVIKSERVLEEIRMVENVFCIGNGESRKGFDLDKLKPLRQDICW